MKDHPAMMTGKKAMRLTDILALRPTVPDRAGLQAAIENAETTLRSVLDRAEGLERQVKASLLTAETETIEAMEREAEQEKLTADRLAMLLGELRASLASRPART